MKEVKRAALTINEAAQMLGISVNTLRQMTDRGEIPCKQIGGSKKYKRRYFIIKDLENWMCKQPDWAEV